METFLCGENRLGDPAPFDVPPVPEDYANTPDRPAPPPDTLASDECRDLLEDSGYSQVDPEDPTLEELIGQLCGRRGGVGAGGGDGGECEGGGSLDVEDGEIVFTPCEEGDSGEDDDDDGGGSDGGGGGGNNPFPGNPFEPGSPPSGGGGGGDGNPFN
jgi:hypothetical protein